MYSDADALRWSLQIAQALEHIHSLSPKVSCRSHCLVTAWQVPAAREASRGSSWGAERLCTRLADRLTL